MRICINPNRRGSECVRPLYIAGQVAVDQNGTLVGPGDFRVQAKQVFENLKSRLAEAGASFKDMVKRK